MLSLETPDMGRRDPQARSALEAWLESLQSKTLHERLIENVAAEPRSHHFEEQEWRNRMDDLARQLFDEPEALRAELTWLNSGEAKAAAEIGHLLGRRDAAGQRFLDQIINAAIEHRADSFARGYVYGLTESGLCDSERLNRP